MFIELELAGYLGVLCLSLSYSQPTTTMRSSSLKGGLSFLLLANVVLAQRKSLAYGPSLGHSKFVTSVPRVPSFKPLSNPLDVAAVYLQSILPLNENGETAVEGVDYFIRDDSYEDASTGVARIFVRQLVGGLEVADADISLNIKDGHVLSYGDSVSLH